MGLLSTDLDHPFSAKDLHPGIIPIGGRATAVKHPQGAIFKGHVYGDCVVEVRVSICILLALEVAPQSEDPLELTAHQPPHGVEIVAVHLGQQPVALLEIAVPLGRKSRTTPHRLHQYRLPDDAFADEPFGL